MSPQLTLSITSHANWSQPAENNLSRDFPWDLTVPENQEEEAIITRLYLQWLWLPSSIFPLHLLLSALLRASSSASALRSLLVQMLLPPRDVRNKYHAELSQILIDGGGNGDLEETVMWYALTHEKHGLPGDCWLDETWRRTYLDRMEKKELQIQILLHLLVLTLPEPSTSQPPVSPAFKKRRLSPVKKKGNETNSDSNEAVGDRLESLIGRLASSQLDITHNATTLGSSHENDWAQSFLVDIIEPLFKSKLPDHVSLIRSTVFPASLFSDAGSSDESDPPPPAKSRQGSLARTKSQTMSPPPNDRRSRSLSVSLAIENEERARADSSRHKRMLSREISMSRVFKQKPATATAPEARAKKEESRPAAAGNVKRTTSQASLGVTLVEATPTKPRQPQQPARARTQSQPVPFLARTMSQTSVQSQSSERPLAPDKEAEEEDEEEIWELPPPSGSSDALVLSVSDEDDSSDDAMPMQGGSGHVSAHETPVKGKGGSKRR